MDLGILLNAMFWLSMWINRRWHVLCQWKTLVCMVWWGCTWVCGYRGTCTYMHEYVEPRGRPWVSSSVTSLLIFGKRPLPVTWNWLIQLSWVAKKPPEILLFLPPHNWDYKFVPWLLGVLSGFWVSNSGPQAMRQVIFPVPREVFSWS